MGAQESKIKCVNNTSQRIFIVENGRIIDNLPKASSYCDPGETKHVNARTNKIYFSGCTGTIQNLSLLGASNTWNTDGIRVECCRNACCLTFSDDPKSRCVIVNKLDECITLCDAAGEPATVHAKSSWPARNRLKNLILSDGTSIDYHRLTDGEHEVNKNYLITVSTMYEEIENGKQCYTRIIATYQ